MKWTKGSFVLGASALLMAVFGFPLNADSNRHHPKGKGLIPPTQQELKTIKKTWPKIVDVLPNKVGAARIQMEMAKKGIHHSDFTVAKSLHEEFLAVLPGESLAPSNHTAAPILPHSVDNSALPSFPPIGDQGMLGSCVAWSSTYYQATHETGLVNGTNNKASNAGVLSPKWTYNMINFGEDNGAYFSDAYALLSQNGATSIANFPYDSDFLAWDLSTLDWISAISKRMGIVKYIAGLDTGNLTSIKSTLNNGHVVTFGTFVDSWVFTTIQSNPNSANKYVGQQAVSWMNGAVGPHMITIVGYDDDVWIDVNGNGQVDPGEKGAFLLANSWGTNWGNDGFMWISYDAFLPTSAVANGPGPGRLPAGIISDSVVMSAVAKAPHYSPTLISLFGLGQSLRDQIKIAAGASNTMQATPLYYFNSGAIFYQGGDFEFDGSVSNIPEMATFALDYSDLILKSPSNQRFYLMVVDDMPMQPTTLNTFSLVDMVHGMTIPFTGMLPKSADNNKITQYIDFTPMAATATIAKPATAAITSPRNNERTSGAVPITISAPNVSRVEVYVDSTLVSTDDTAPFFVLLDTTKFKNGRHRVSVVGYDAMDQVLKHSVTFKIYN